MKIAALIQARMGATRLPGKVLMEVEGHPILWHVVARLKNARKLDRIAVVTTTESRDDAIEKFCRGEGVDFFRGSEEDVLDRYYQAATVFKADHIVRITSDCPLIDPAIVDEIVSLHLSAGADYTSNTMNRTYPRGFDTEIFTYAALKKANAEAREQSCREHVTVFFYTHPEIFKLVSNTAPEGYQRPEIRLCVDTQEDLKLMQLVFKELKDRSMIEFRDVARLFDRKPELLKINSMIEQKSI